MNKYGNPKIDKLVKQQAKEIMRQYNIEYQYLDLLQDILDNGVEKKDRTGTGTLSVFGRQIRHKMSDGFPALTTKKFAFKTMVTELLWFLRGSTNIKYLLDNNCHIWDGDVYKQYEKVYAHDLDSPQYTQKELMDLIQNDEMYLHWGDLGPIYGKQWRSWGRKNVTNYDLKDIKGSDQPKVVQAIKNSEDVTKYDVKVKYQNNSIDQIANLIKELKTNPDSRRLMVNAWNVGELDQMVLPPCHYGFQVYTRELSDKERISLWDKRFGFANEEQQNQFNPNIHLDTHGIPTRAISLIWNQRSVDTFLGLPFNIASYGLLLEIIAEEVNMIPDELIGNLGDVHLYKNHIEQAKEQLTREPFGLPSICLDYREREYNKDLTDLIPEDIVLFNYKSHPKIKASLSN